MPTTSTYSLTLRMCAVALCFASLTGCPREDSPASSQPDAGHSHEGGSSAVGGSGAAGSGGTRSEGGKGGVGGKPSAGAGGRASAGVGGQAGSASGDDAGVGKLCGTRGASACEADEFCNFEPDKDCGATDRGGACETKPEVCDAQLAPVCGCDSKTYSNVCEAHRAGQSSLHAGSCTVSDCERIGGRVAVGIGPAPMCESDEVEHTFIVNNDGSLAIEGMLCCLKK
jgi:hypothetical protein